MIKPYLDDPQVKNVLEERLPLAREGELEDVTNTSLYLAPHESNLGYKNHFEFRWQWNRFRMIVINELDVMN